MLRGFFWFLGSLLLVCAGCGGGGGTTGGSSGNGGGGGGGTPPPQVPTLISLAPSSANVGSPSITLTLYGSNFQQGATAEWNGASLSTTWVSATTLIATVPTMDLAGAGNAQVLVSNSGTNSSSKSFSVSAAPTPGTWVRAVSGITNPERMVYDSAHSKIYVSMSSNDPNAPNTIVPVDPVSGTAGTPIPAGNGPDLMSVSSDGSHLWAALDGDSAVQRFLLPGLTKDISVPIPLSSGGQKEQAISLEAARVNAHTMAMVVGTQGNPNGVYVFDDTTQRANFLAGGAPGVTWIQWGADDSILYGGPEVSSLNVDAAGVTWTKPTYSPNLSPGPSIFDPISGLLYWQSWAFDPVKNIQTGTFGGGGQTGVGLAGGCTSAVNSALGRFYCLIEASNADSRLLVFDQKSYDFLGSFDLGNVITWEPGVAQYLIPWGNAGLALLSPSSSGSSGGGLFLIDGAAVNPNAAPDFTSGAVVASPIASLATVSPQGTAAGSPDVTLTITGSGFTQSSLVYSDYGHLQSLSLPTSYISPNQLTATLPAAAMTTAAPLIITVWDDFASRLCTNSLVFTVYPSGNTQIRGVNLSGLSMGWDPSASLLYVGTSFYDPTRPNSVVAIDPMSGTAVASVSVLPEPYLLDIAPDNSRLFLGYAASTNLSELSLPRLSSFLSWPLIAPQGAGPYFAGDLKAAPDSPATTAVTLFVSEGSPAAQGGIVIFDDNVPRPDFAPGWTQPGNSGQLYDTLAWSNSNSALAAAENEGDPTVLHPLNTLNVGSSGVVYSASFQKYNTVGAEIHSDFGTGLIYSDDGTVASPFDGSFKGSYGASGLVVPDSSTQRVYILGQTAAQSQTTSYNYTIQSFNESTFAPMGSITLPSLTGVPFKMLRWGSSGLAVLVLNPAANAQQGPETMLYLLNDTSFVTSGQPATANPDIGERVQARWTRMTAHQIAGKSGGATALTPP